MKENNYPYYLDAYQEGVLGTPGTFPLRKSDIKRLAEEQGIGGGAKVDPQQTEVTFTENGVNVIEPLQGFDGMSSVKVTVDVAGGGGGDYSKWEIGDIVIYDNVDDKKIKSTVNDFSLDKYPESRYTAIGVIAFVMEDGSARMLALPAMSTETPDVGSDKYQTFIWGYSNLDISGLTDYTKAAIINHETGEVINTKNASSIPSTCDQFIGAMSLDGLRSYYSTSDNKFSPSPYNADGTLNSAFTQSSLTIGPLYCWSRTSGSTTYYMYTDTETPSLATTLWCGSLGYNSQVKNYGNSGKIGDSYSSGGSGPFYLATMLGSILDESVFDGGVEAFVANFTAVSDSTYEETFLLANSDMDGKTNCTVILGKQTGVEWRTADSLVNEDREGNYPIATSTWRFHTPGTSQGDWYCPSAGELSMMTSNFSQIQTGLKKLKSVVSVPVALLDNNYSYAYWSSSEVNNKNAWHCSTYGNLSHSGKGSRSGRYLRAFAIVPVLD